MRSKQDYLTLRCRTASLDAHLENMNLKIEINNYLKTDEATFSRTIAAARGTSRAGGPDRSCVIAETARERHETRIMLKIGSHPNNFLYNCRNSTGIW